MEHQPAQRAIDNVEWLAALCQLRGEGEPPSANPHLLTLLRFTPKLGDHPAFECVSRLRRAQSRDQLIKALVNAAYTETAGRGELDKSLQAFGADVEELLGSGPHGVIGQARAEAAQRTADIAGELDPATDLAEITGERLPLRVVLAPSVFLPPPQAGRHGALLRRPNEWVAHLHFGFPLHQVPGQFSIGRPWLLGGGWHYAIHLYLEGCWPEVARRLADEEELSLALAAALSEHAEGSVENRLRAHVNVALKCLLSRRLGVPDSVHRAFAQARGLVLFPWFEEWLLGSGVEGAELAQHIAALPEALAASRPRWERMARSGSSLPSVVNLALVSPSARRASLVVPDTWSEDAAAAAVAGWRLLPLPLVRYGDWMRTRAGSGDPVIAFGEPENNPLVRRVLEQRGLSLASLDAAEPAIIALSLPGFEDAPWCLAVAVKRPQAAAGLRMEMALKHTNSYVIFESGIPVGAGRVALEPSVPDAPGVQHPA